MNAVKKDVGVLTLSGLSKLLLSFNVFWVRSVPGSMGL